MSSIIQMGLTYSILTMILLCIIGVLLAILGAIKKTRVFVISGAVIFCLAIVSKVGLRAVIDTKGIVVEDRVLTINNSEVKNLSFNLDKLQSVRISASAADDSCQVVFKVISDDNTQVNTIQRTMSGSMHSVVLGICKAYEVQYGEYSTNPEVKSNLKYSFD